MTRRQLKLVVLPAVAFVAIAALFAMTDLDRAIARSWAFDPILGAFPARGARWSTNLLHDGGRHLVWAIWFATVGTYLASFVAVGWRVYRRPALFAFVAIGLATLTVNLLKAISNVDCPWDLADFGGALPYVPFFAGRPGGLPHAACFPGSHSSSGFALVAFYFALNERWRGASVVALLSALAVGTVFAFGQEARGAHFLSHDLWSAFIVWFVELALYSWSFGGQLWPQARQSPRESYTGLTAARIAPANTVV
jgi:membrane-associated PAP2 superfamily phosphatase